MDEDYPSENPYPSQPRPPTESSPPRPTACRGITIERQHPVGCCPRPKKGDKSSLNSPSSNKQSSSASSKSKLEKNPAIKNTAVAGVKPIPVPQLSNAQMCSSCPPNANERLQSAVNAHQKAVATLKCAVKDFVCKAYTSTQDAITKISVESNKHFQNIKKSACDIIPDRADKKCNCPPKVKKVSDSLSDSNLSRFNLVNVDSSNLKDKGTAPNNSQSNTNEQINKAFTFLLEKVDSAVTVLSDKVCQSLQPKSFNDRSSKYDVPRPKPKECGCEAVEESQWLPGNLHLFSSMSDKVWGLFFDDDKTTISSRRSSTTTIVSEADDDFINTVLE